MKIKNIAAICKKNKYAVIYERYGENGGVIQYIGDGAAAYPVTGLPKLDKESLLTIFDVPEKQREDWFVQVAGIPSKISFEDAAATDKTAKCPLYYTPETDGLSQSWDRGGAVFCNPPYGREIGKWVKKAYEEAIGGGTLLCYLFRRGRIRSIFTITYTGKRKSGSFAGGFASQTTKGTRAIPRPSLLW